MGITILATIFVFSLIIFVHELGHFATAKWAGMQVDEFAIGFGPKIGSVRRGETEYSLRAVPLGGFNRIAGMSEDETLNERSFLSKSVTKRLIVIAAGGIMNFVLAIVLLWGLFFAVGTITVSPEAVVGSTIAGSPAAQSGLEAGDRIVRIGNTDISRWSDISQAVAPYSHDVVTVEIERDGQRQGVEMVPEIDSTSKKAMLGVMPLTTKESHGFLESGAMAVQRTGKICRLMLVGLYQMVTGEEKAEVAGPIGVAQLAGQVAASGFANLLMFTAFLSLNLGILNLLPVPLLDGGYIILLILEGITRRRMPKRALYYIQVTGAVLLGSLFLFAMFQDISRF
ncbi:RIP metalloprotease RseP [uncultured Megasphaera sp.]|uniref:RIP metalloprotease RseP n=1 Tax=uncultured Megasphaera sp. TaxID=165188 RepID=UPI0025FAC5D5|nr:RIP metalloprotease RseP [uncultured Megasphaera sp.]